MIELLLTDAKPTEMETGEVVLFLDMATATTTGIPSTSTLSGAVTDTGYLIDGLPTLSIPGASDKAKFTLNTPLNLEVGNGHFTIEWSFVYHAPFTSSYATNFFLLNGDNATGMVSLVGDAGFDNRWYYYTTPAGNPAGSWLTPEVKNTLAGQLIHAALVCRNEKLYLYKNGQLVTVFEYGTFTPLTGVPKKIEFNNITTLNFGYWSGAVQNVASHYGNVRISNYARYVNNYAPGPLTL